MAANMRKTPSRREFVRASSCFGTLSWLEPQIIGSPREQTSSAPPITPVEPIEIPEAAYRARVNRVRAVMAQRKADALVIASVMGLPSGFDSRYLARHFPAIVVVPSDSEITLIVVDPVSPRPRTADTWIPDVRWAKGWQRAFDVAVDRLKELPRAPHSIALAGEFGWVLQQKLGAAFRAIQVQDGDEIQDVVRLVKDEYELQLLRNASKIADAQIQRGFSAVRTGRTMQEIYADTFQTGYALGSSRSEVADIPGYAPGDATHIMGGSPRHRMAAGEVYLYEPIPFVGHYNVETVVTYALGKVPAEQTALAELSFESFQAAAAQLRPDVPVLAAVKAARSVVQKSGYIDNTNGTGHFIGLSNVERPPIEADPGVVLKPNMVVAIHGNLIGGGGKYKAAQGCCFLITPKGSEPLTQLRLEPMFLLDS